VSVFSRSRFKDIESFADVRLAPGTLYEALNRLEGLRLIEPVPSDDRLGPTS
jgi:DNA-binding PadR family transcriptional regulator